MTQRDAATPPDETAGLTIDLAETGGGRYQSEVQAGFHKFFVDQPPAVGGLGSGATPFELLCAALGACTSMTLRVFADERRWLLPNVSVRVVLVHAEDGAPRLERTIALEGHLDPEQRDVLLAAADRSPVLALLHPDIPVVTRLGPIGDPVEAERKASVDHWIALHQALRAS